MNIDSGHGGQTKDLNGDEIDGWDEGQDDCLCLISSFPTNSGNLPVIYPVDFRKAGHIIDDEMHKIMVKPLPIGCRLTVNCFKTAFIAVTTYAHLFLNLRVSSILVILEPCWTCLTSTPLMEG